MTLTHIALVFAVLGILGTLGACVTDAASVVQHAEDFAVYVVGLCLPLLDQLQRAFL